MKCPNCGAQIGRFTGESYTCEYCRSTFHRSEFDPRWSAGQDDNVREIHHYHHQQLPDRLGGAMGCLCVLFFPLGLVLYFLYRDSFPNKARTALIITAVMFALIVLGVISGTT